RTEAALGGVPTCAPPLPEQRAIANYLGRQMGAIDRLVRKKERLIELLNEERESLISQAVTRGLDPEAPTRDSGVEWLGEIPAHWEVRRLRNVVTMRVSNVDKHARKGETPIRLCNYVDVYKHDYIGQQIDFMRSTATPEEIARFRLEEGDVLITKDSEAWDDIGVPSLVTEPAEDLISGYHLALLRPVAGVLIGSHLLRALQSKGLAHQFHVEAKGVTRYGLSHSSIKSVWLPVPPLPEQVAIADFLDRETGRTDALVAKTREAIERLCEYRGSVISAAVTGQIDLRESMAAL
ncbi:MAG: restriction endonuclease subunit S, partial [Bryobacterales bacterium]|nr:restriction endonuclease subunit S [Bryobacterales bacterium]